MCWCFKVFFHVFRNLANRIFNDLFAESYKMCSSCFCRKRSLALSSPGESEFTEYNAEIKESFYKDIDRETSEKLLKSKQNGTFIIRPTKSINSIGTLSLIQDGRIYHLNIRRRNDEFIALGTEKLNEKVFAGINNLINYYISNYLVLISGDKQSKTLLLPYYDQILAT